MYKTELFKLGNGLRLIYCFMPQALSVSTVIGILSGSIYENDQQKGISHFIEHMLFKGTPDRKNTLEISRCIEELGGEINASTSEECTFLYSKVLHKNFSSAFEVMWDVLTHSLFRQEDIKNEKTVIIEEINKYQDIPEDWISFLINQLLWKDTVLSHNVLGEKKTVKSFNRQKIMDYFQNRYQPENVVISVTGNIQPEQVQAAVDSITDFPGKTITTPLPEIKLREQMEPQLRLLARKVNQAHLCLGFSGLSRFDPDKISLDLLNIILGAGLSSRLFQEVRVKEGLAYDIHSYTQYYNQTGSFNVYAGVDPDKIEHSIQKILQELKRIREEKINQHELQKAKEMYKGSILLGLESTLSHAFRLNSHLLVYNKEYIFQELIEKIEKIQSQNLTDLARKILKDSKINLIVFYPAGKKMNRDKLKNILVV